MLGDAACSFNPVYAQGMAASALGAAELDACLAERRARGGADPLAGFSREFQRRLARVTDAPWLLATGEDFRSPHAQGERPAWMPLLGWYTARVHELTWRDRFAARRFLEVMHLVKRPTALFHPWIALRALAVAVSWLERRAARSADAAPSTRFRSPIPTQVVSNGEYMPTAQSDAQRRVEQLLMRARRPPRQAPAASIAAQLPQDQLRHGGRVRRDEPGLRRAVLGRRRRGRGARGRGRARARLCARSR